ncbi:peroxisomal coenzyme A diphosphatase NUDT7 isoform X2 [Hyla sarda]|uniref:peroxisomal coenzyme A diphosphatase NUDT7 isoform X2 n=1 Tax=Hyla sarda TaxID=327740 RepID=UPI0024C2D8E4|nr:peroxisomal coenzyme A diphosphatase NUDT7 isoform X2 [Hyla sarda]
MCPRSSEQSPDHMCLREKIKSLLGKYDVGSQYSHIPLTKASILLPLLIRQGKPHLVLTVRSMQLQTMPGQVCFPGGRQEPTDEDDIQTALRESKEEIGLCPEQVEIIGRLMPCLTKSPVYLVTPVVGIVEDSFQPTPNPSEVADVFLVPLEFFISTEHYTPLQSPSPHRPPQVPLPPHPTPPPQGEHLYCCHQDVKYPPSLLLSSSPSASAPKGI